jgi:hypothetical protein
VTPGAETPAQIELRDVATGSYAGNPPSLRWKVDLTSHRSSNKTNASYAFLAASVAEKLASEVVKQQRTGSL